jgi:hypothetical protein
MNPDLQKSLRKHIECFLENNPGSSIKDTKQWLRKGVHAQTIHTLKKQAFNNFVKRNMKIFDTNMLEVVVDQRLRMIWRRKLWNWEKGQRCKH